MGWVILPLRVAGFGDFAVGEAVGEAVEARVEDHHVAGAVAATTTKRTSRLTLSPPAEAYPSSRQRSKAALPLLYRWATL